MSLLDEQPRTTLGGAEAEALIKEARERQHKRRLSIGIVVLIVAVASGIWAASGGGSATKPPSTSKKPGHTKTPVSTPSSTRKGATPLSIDFDGKYGLSTPAFPTASEGFVAFGGLVSGNGPGVAWLERTTDGGRTWSIQPNFTQSFVAFNSAADGWAYGPSLLKTTDAGRTWQRVHIEGFLGSVASVVTAGRYTWFTEQPRPGAHSNPACVATPLLFRSTRLGADPSPITVQPSLGGYCTTQFIALTGLNAYLLFVKRSDASRLAATSDGGNSWALRTVPCDGTLIDENSFLLGLSCPYGQPGEGLVRMFDSNDGGSTWVKVRPFNGGFVNENGPLVGSLVRSSSLVAWSWTEYIGAFGAGAVERTADGGRHWRTIFPNGAIHVVPPLRPVSFMLPVALVVRSASSALLAVEVYARSGPNHFLLGTTTNGGSTWRWSYLVNERSGTTKGRAG
jgi:photosystem II stability/assembly factor-like uncharacterized protein